MLFAQQGWVDAPQAVQPPVAHTVFAAEHALPMVRHWSEPGSQQSLPKHEGVAVGQQNWFWCPHAPH